MLQVICLMKVYMLHITCQQVTDIQIIIKYNLNITVKFSCNV